MYSERIIDRNLDQFAREEGWMPVRHTFGEVQDFIAYMKKVVTLDSNSKGSWIKSIAPMTEKRQQEIKRWIENEQIMCGLSYPYWRDNYAYVVDEGGQVVKFKNRRSQDVFDSVVADLEERQAGIQILTLKARQVGITTLVALMFIHRMMFIPNILAVMASVQKEKSEEIKIKLDTAHGMCPFWLVPYKTPKNSFSNDSRLSIESGMQPKGIAQGKSPQCLVPSALVRMANGFVKKISDVTKEDSIITHSGKMISVKEAFKALRGPDVTRILKIWGYYNPLECSLDHRINTPQGWVEASEISVGDYVCHPVRPISKEVKVSQAYTRPTGRSNESARKYFDVPLTPSLGYLCGFYLAEGTCHGNRSKSGGFLSEVIFGVHQREISDRLEKIHAALGKNQSIRVYKRTKNGAAITVTNAWFARWIAEHFGRKTEKIIPDWVWSAGKPFCEALLHGYIDGDGHYDKQSNNVVAMSICQQLILQMRDLVASLGIGWSSIYFKPETLKNKYGSHQRPVWRLILSGATGYRYRRLFGWQTKPTKNGKGRHWRYSQDGNNIELMVEAVSNGFSDEFYDIEIAHRDHSFTTDQCAVHNCVHISEIGIIPNPHNVIEEGLLPATHSNRNLFMVFEGTGSGNVGWFPDFWRTEKKNWPGPEARMRPVFISWPLATDLYPQADWLRANPVPANFFEKRLEATRIHITRCESYIRNTPYLAKVVGSNYRVPIEQQWYWQGEYVQARERHSLHQHAARLPADDFEALTGEHDSVFDEEVIMELEDKIYEIRTDGKRNRREPLQVYAITGHSIDEEFEPDELQIDYSKEIIDLTWRSNRDERYDWALIPLLPIDEESETESFDKLLVFEPPQKGMLYSCGVDTAHGLGYEDEDRFCASMTRVSTGSSFDMQCAELTSNRFSPAQAVPFLAAMATWYGKGSGSYRGVKFSIEQVEGPGDTCQNQLKIMGFGWHHTPGRLDGKKIKDENKHREGWYSNRVTVPILMDRFVEAVNGGWYVPQSKWLIEELKTLERHVVSGGRDKMEHQQNAHDDRVRAAAQSYLNLHTYDDLAARSQRRYAVPSKKRDEGERLCLSNTFSVGDWRD